MRLLRRWYRRHPRWGGFVLYPVVGVVVWPLMDATGIFGRDGLAESAETGGIWGLAMAVGMATVRVVILPSVDGTDRTDDRE
ncbi:hypothetical protein [Luteipulveratus flavus]|uniref:Uncharacterized protein n=1 Tax=Luteipulveratus flavus TaxID=3031728 RepID=A0ABT6C305_9MICO|nr:hypothetical protein [Luteipulveratus sp. YIM 133296]MDF8262667.1 hypothetical protein [Luteipulveratus sp. YIM 133296]